MNVYIYPILIYTFFGCFIFGDINRDIIIGSYLNNTNTNTNKFEILDNGYNLLRINNNKDNIYKFDIRNKIINYFVNYLICMSHIYDYEKYKVSYNSQKYVKICFINNIYKGKDYLDVRIS